MTKYRYGDKITVEFEVMTAYKDGSFTAIQKGRHNSVSFRSTDPIASHDPKPIEPEAGQLWSDRNQEYHHRVKAVFDGFVVFMNSTSNQPHTLTIGQFQKSRRYVSG